MRVLFAAVAVIPHFIAPMPHATTNDEHAFKLIRVKELHPTFGAEVQGVDFSKPVSADVFSEIYKAITKVRMTR